MYVDGTVNINDDVSLADEYIVANGDIFIDVTGYIRNCVFISTGGSVYITCRNIENDSTDGKASHKMIQAANDIVIYIDDSNASVARQGIERLKNVVAYSENGQIIVDDYDTYSSNKFTRSDQVYNGYYFSDQTLSYNQKIWAKNCYFYTDNGKQTFENVFFDYSYANSRNDIILDNCSGNYTTFYSGNGSTTDSSIVIDTSQRLANAPSQTLDLSSASVFYMQNLYNDCDFMADKNVYSGTSNLINGGVKSANIIFNYSRLIANDYLYIHSGLHYNAYMFAHASPTDTTDGIFIYTVQEFETYPYKDIEYVIRVYMFDSVLYSREDIYYYQNTMLENLNSSSEIMDVKFMYNTMYYCKNDFIYAGQAYKNMTQAADPNKNSPDMLNDMYIMAEHEVRPAEDDNCFLVIGRKMAGVLQQT